MLPEAQAWPEIAARSEQVNQWCEKGRYDEARAAACDLRLFIVTRCLPSPALQAKLSRLEATIVRLDECGFGPGGAPAQATPTCPPVENPARQVAARVAALACLVAVVIGLVWVGNRAFLERSALRTGAGWFVLPGTVTAQGGDASDGWAGNLASADRGWILTWRYQERHPASADATDLNHVQVLRLRGALPGLEKIVPLASRDMLEREHPAHQVSYRMNIPQATEAVAVLWHCEQSHRHHVATIWDSDEARRNATVTNFVQGRWRCHGDGVPAASPLPLPHATLPAGFRQVDETPEYVVMKNDEDQLVWLGKGLPRISRGEFSSEEAQRGRYDRIPTVKAAYLGQQRTLPSGRSPHLVFQAQGMGHSSPDERSPCRPQVCNTWYCPVTERVYVVSWQGREQAVAPSSPDFNIESTVPHPAFMDAPCCVESCQSQLTF